jgi:hypothetical protein
MHSIEIAIKLVLLVLACFNPNKDLAEQNIAFENITLYNATQTVIYNYTYLYFYSPFSLNYSNVVDKKIEIRTEPMPIFEIKPKDKDQKDRTISFFIEIEKKCPLPNKANIILTTNEKSYFISKSNGEIKFYEYSNQDADIKLIMKNYPESIEEAKKMISEENIKIILNKNPLILLSSGYGKTFQCLKSL